MCLLQGNRTLVQKLSEIEKKKEMEDEMKWQETTTSNLPAM